LKTIIVTSWTRNFSLLIKPDPEPLNKEGNKQKKQSKGNTTPNACHEAHYAIGAYMNSLGFIEKKSYIQHGAVGNIDMLLVSDQI